MVAVAAIEWYEVALRIGAAAGLGGLIGLEREFNEHDAGFRTHLLLAVGAALFGSISVAAFDDYIAARATTNVNIDITRIASYVAAGVGFIGGGAILKSSGGVRGITTATSLWAAAAVGTAAGVGFWSGAVAGTVITLIALALLRPVGALVARFARPNHSILIRGRPGFDLAAVMHEVQSVLGDGYKQIRIGGGEDDTVLEVAIDLWAEPDEFTANRLFTAVSTAHDVVSVQISGATRRAST